MRSVISLYYCFCFYESSLMRLHAGDLMEVLPPAVPGLRPVRPMQCDVADSQIDADILSSISGSFRTKEHTALQ